jgi:hypothetical protein
VKFADRTSTRKDAPTGLVEWASPKLLVFLMENHDEKSTGKDTNGQGVSEPSDGTSQSRTPQGGGQGNSSDGKSGGRDSSQPGGQND